MREILFRGKPVNKADYTLNENMECSVGYFKDGFAYGFLVVIKDEYYICVGVTGVLLNSLVNNATATMIEVIPETVSQYTGLKDKKGNKIFEGDILKSDYDDSSYYKVAYDSEGKAFLSWGENIAHYGVEDDCEIIGNIYAEQSDTELTLNYWM